MQRTTYLTIFQDNFLYLHHKVQRYFSKNMISNERKPLDNAGFMIR